MDDSNSINYKLSGFHELNESCHTCLRYRDDKDDSNSDCSIREDEHHPEISQGIHISYKLSKCHELNESSKYHRLNESSIFHELNES